MAPYREGATTGGRPYSERPRWYLPTVTFLVGLLVGWLVVGWWLWPVTWKNSLPPDLRAAERDEYLITTAESMANTNDVERAKSRVATWPPDRLAEDLTRLQDRLASENPMQAGQVQTLASALGVYNQLAAAPATARAPLLDTSKYGALLRNLCTGALWVLLIVGGLGLIVWLWGRWRAAHGVASDSVERGRRGLAEPSSQGGPLPAFEGEPAIAGEQVGGGFGAPWSRDAQLAPVEGGYGGTAPTKAASSSRQDELVQPLTVGLSAVAGASEASNRAAAPASGRAPAVAATTGAGAETVAGAPTVKVGEFTATYLAGETDYDEAFDITDASGAYIGQCGVTLSDPIGRSHDQAAALQVWLWDTNDPDTKVKVLMSEGAYRDTVLRDQLAGDQPATSIKPGSEFELSSYKLALRGVVEKLEYTEGELAYGIFSDVVLRLQAYQREK